MGYISIIVLSGTFTFLLGGIVCGLFRGFNRSLLRLVLVAVSVGLAFLLRGWFVNVLMNLNTPNGTLKDSITRLFAQGDSVPTSVQNLIVTLVELIIGVIAFVGIFYTLSVLTWLFAFPILKIWVKKGNKKRSLLGALVGLAQGALMAVAVIAPVSGILVQVNKLEQLEMQNQKVLTVPSELGLDEYVHSSVCAVYDVGGGWLFNALTTTTGAEQTISVSDTCDVIVAVGELTGAVEDLSESMDLMTSATATPVERIDAMKTVGEKLQRMDDTIEGLGNNAKAIINEVLSEVADMLPNAGEMPDEMGSILDDLTVEDLNLGAVGEALVGLGNYIEKTDEAFGNDEPVTDEEIQDIVNGIAETPLMLNVLRQNQGAGALLDVGMENSDAFRFAIDNTDLSYEDKELLLGVFGLNG